MGYPYPPQGQYPQQQYPQQQYPPPQKPSSAAPIATGVLAILGGTYGLAGLVLYLVAIGATGSNAKPVIQGLVVTALLTGLLLPGGILVLVRKKIGRQLVIFGALLLLISHGWLAASAATGGPMPGGAGRVIAGTVLLASLVLLLLAWGPATTRWVVTPVATPQYQQYPQQQYPPQQRPPGW